MQIEFIKVKKKAPKQLFRGNKKARKIAKFD